MPIHEPLRRNPPAWFPVRDPAAVSPPRRLLCLPYAGGSPAMYQRWGRELGDLVEVVPLCLPGRAHRFTEPCAEKMDQLADDIAAAVEVLLDRPLAMFGYSLGALVAFEVARRLAGRGTPPFLLIAAACPAPCRVPTTDRSRQLTDEEFIQMLRELEATPDAILDNPEMIALLLPMLRADFALADRYEYAPAPKVGTRIVTVAGRADSIAPPDSMADWARETDMLSHIVVDGGHLFIDEDEPRLLACVRRETVTAYRQ